jgi:hypothetical protein
VANPLAVPAVTARDMGHIGMPTGVKVPAYVQAILEKFILYWAQLQLSQVRGIPFSLFLQKK